MSRRFEEYEDMLSNKRGYWLSVLISFLITGAICGSIFLIQYFGTDFEIWEIWINALTLSGGLMILFYLLTLLTNQGVFDALTYGIKLAWTNLFHKNLRKTKLARTYAEYREEKNRGNKRNMSFMVIGGAPYLLVGLILLIPYYTIIR